MILVFHKYTDYVKRLKEALQDTEEKVRLSVLEDDGFLPDEAMSPYDFFVSEQNCRTYEKRDLFFDFIEIPEFWEIRADGIHGGVYDMGQKKASIYFRNPIEKRNVQRVEWQFENGQRYKIDYYNKYGNQYASEFLSTDGRAEEKVYYSDQRKEVIIENKSNDTIILLRDGNIRAFFTSKAHFAEYYLEALQPEGIKILIVTEEKQFPLMYLKHNGGELWRFVLFKKREHLERYIAEGGKNGYMFYGRQDIYPPNSAEEEALILTASDQIEGIEYLIEKLPYVHFHIAANTQVSEKLYNLMKYENVKVYPQISSQDLSALWEKCKFYLDINRYHEILDAIETAHRNNLLILGFEDTVHNSDLLADESVFLRKDYEGMCQMMERSVNFPEQMQKILEKQQDKKRAVWESLLNSLNIEV